MNPFFNNPLFLDNHDPTPPNFQSDSSSSDETERFINLFTMAHYAIQQDVRDTASSSRTYTRRDDRGESHNRLFRDYFAEEPKFNETFFRQRFRMSRRLFVKIASDLENNFSFFQRKIDARGKWGFSPLQRCTSAVRQLGYGSNPDSLDDYLNMSERSSRDTLNAFCDGVIKLYRHEYCVGQRVLIRDAFLIIMRLIMVSPTWSLDCTHWAWDNCPVAWRGQYTRGDHHGPTISLEAVASQDCWIWHAYFGVASSNNDINVLNQSPLFNPFEDGTAPLVPFTVNGTEYQYPHYLVDGIYPRYAMFVKTISHPTGEKRIRYAKVQEAARKDVERAFDEDHAISPDYIPDPPVAPQPSDERLFEIQNPNKSTIAFASTRKGDNEK
uniref:uncharacterized protein LOC122589057 n=1 Tax=Erigeron canadensis TaxID=72917 RepID=UPI001CB8F449|nr:uncharacterized protein LOC122589057 [Erigeron canadensis]